MRTLKQKQITLGYNTASGIKQAGQQITQTATNDPGACMIVNLGKGVISTLGHAPVCAVSNYTDTWSRGLTEDDEENQTN
ncbi:MAG: hypothetical protein K6G50_13970 [bacterium]|nr:hypothetical protein [bacterium]